MGLDVQLGKIQFTPKMWFRDFRLGVHIVFSLLITGIADSKGDIKPTLLSIFIISRLVLVVCSVSCSYNFW